MDQNIKASADGMHRKLSKVADTSVCWQPSKASAWSKRSLNVLMPRKVFGRRNGR